jgi:hypothetical protein
MLTSCQLIDFSIGISNKMYAFLMSPARDTYPTHFNCLDFTALTIRGDVYKSLSCSARGNPLPQTLMFPWRLLMGIVLLLEGCVPLIVTMSVEKLPAQKEGGDRSRYFDILFPLPLHTIQFVYTFKLLVSW